MAALFAERGTTYKVNTNRIYGHEFAISFGEGPTSIRWRPGRTYALVLLAARKAVEKLKTIERMTSNFMDQEG